MNKSYRQEIDGLRGLSIISVVLYHLEIPYFQGGFLGVDIFFLPAICTGETSLRKVNNIIRGAIK
jgi:uncharacterized membrane protein YcfT